MSFVYIDQHGFHMPTFSELLERKKDDFRAIFGADVYLEPDSQEGQMLAMFAKAEFDCCQLAEAVYNSFSPCTAQGVGLSRLVKINGISRKPASHSSADVTLVGTAGTIIKNGMAKDKTGKYWKLPQSVVIPETGEITVTVIAEETGAIHAAAGEINGIATPTLGWQSVINKVAATQGRKVESDFDLRLRQQKSTALPSRTVLAGIAGAIANLDGVKSLKIYENDTDTINKFGMSPHSIAVVVDGGDRKSIAQVIANKKTPGVCTLGNVRSVVTDSQGMPNTIRFYRCENIPIELEITLKAYSGYLSVTGEKIKQNLERYVDSLGIGETVLFSKLYTPINGAESNIRGKTFDVLELKGGFVGKQAMKENLIIPFTARAFLEAAKIKIKVVGDE